MRCSESRQTASGLRSEWSRSRGIAIAALRDRRLPRMDKAMKASVSALVIVLSMAIWIVGMWIVFCLALVFLAEPPKHLIWPKFISLLSMWLGAFALYRILYQTDFWGGRSLIESGLSAYRHWFINLRAQSKMFRVFLALLSFCVLLRIIADVFHLARLGR
jgi:hypothetical protein